MEKKSSEIMKRYRLEYEIFPTRGIFSIESNDLHDILNQLADLVKKHHLSDWRLSLTVQDQDEPDGLTACDECGACIPDTAKSIVNTYHLKSCSLYPEN